MKRRFFTLDVFTDRRFAGNPLAVVLDAQGLSDDAMQTIAREFNLSETVFVLPPAEAGHRAALRIFTPARELPFAGHPTVGTAVLLALRDSAGAPGEASFTLGETIGPVPCRIGVIDSARGRAQFALPRLPEALPADYDVAALAVAFGCRPQDIGFGRHRPALYSAGVPFPLVPVASRAVLNAMRTPELRGLEQALGSAAGGHVFLYCREPENPAHHFHARMFAPGLGVPEDPATGSAVAAFAGAIVACEGLADGEHKFVIEQGYAMGRPSQIELMLDVRNGALRAAEIGGGAVVVTEGALWP